MAPTTLTSETGQPAGRERSSASSICLLLHAAAACIVLILIVGAFVAVAVVGLVAITIAIAAVAPRSAHRPCRDEDDDESGLPSDETPMQNCPTMKSEEEGDLKSSQSGHTMADQYSFSFACDPSSDPLSREMGSSSYLPVNLLTDEKLKRDIEELKRDIEELKKTRECIHTALEDEESPIIWDQPTTLWVRELRDLACDAEGLVEEYEYKVGRAEQVGAVEEDCNRYKPSDDEVEEPLDTVHDGVNLMRSRIYARGRVTESLLSYAAMEDGDYPYDVPVVAIVGMGGSGKTTLAQLLYNDPEVRSRFCLKGWVSVSQPWDVTKLYQSIIESFTYEPCMLTELDPLHKILANLVEDKSFLLVLDDARNNDDSCWLDGSLPPFLTRREGDAGERISGFWNRIVAPLRSGAPGSRVLITSREEIKYLRNPVSLHGLGPINNCGFPKGDPIHQVTGKGVANEECFPVPSPPVNVDFREEIQSIKQRFFNINACRRASLNLAGPTAASTLNLLTDAELKRDIEELKKTREWILAALEDAENLITWDQSITLWVRELRDLAYDAEDLVAEYEHEVRRAEQVEADKDDRGKGVADQVCFPIASSPVTVDFRKEIQSINQRFCNISARRASLNLLGPRTLDSQSRQQQPTGSLLTDPVVYGRDQDERRVKKLLKPDDDEDDGGGGDSIDDVLIVAVVGMGGLGKTTLAQLLYNDTEIRSHFNPMGWVHASQHSNSTSLAQSIIQSFNGEACGLNELSALQGVLVAAVKDRRFLLVLDDVWSHNHALCNEILAPLIRGAPGSKILVTTRDEGFQKKITSPVSFYRMDHLSDDDCWLLFQRHAFGGGGHAPKTDDDIKSKVVDKCRGLPLAARILGGLLKSKDKRSWMRVLDSDVRKSDHDGDDEILGVLKLSYIHLPAHLKRCFAACSMFPKGSPILISRLVRVWIALYLVQAQNIKLAFDLGLEYMNDLLARSLLQSSRYDQGEVDMHDLVHDLSQNVYGEKCNVDSIFRNTPSTPGSTSTANELRGIRACCQMSYPVIERSRKGLHFICLYMKTLRVLILTGCAIRELPESIGDVNHLRYLELGYCSRLLQLPKSLCRLQNLQFFLSECISAKLPKSFMTLTSLRHLRLALSHYDHIFPPGIGRLTRLEELPHFVVGEDKKRHASIEDLKDLTNLRGKLEILNIGSVTGPKNAKMTCCLKDKEHLDALKLSWLPPDLHSKTRQAYSTRKEHSVQVFEALEPHANLAILEICSYYGSKFPGWLGHSSSLVNLSFLSLEGCIACQDLPPLGQLPLLKELRIRDLESVKCVGFEFYYYNHAGCSNTCNIKSIEKRGQHFTSLHTLEFSGMNEWEMWEDCGVGEDESCQFINLRKLFILSCPKLRVIKCAFPFLAELELSDCPNLTTLPAIPSIRKLTLTDEWNKKLLLSEDAPSLPTVKVLDLYRDISEKSFPLYKCMYKLPNLEELLIYYYAELERIEWAPFHVYQDSSQLLDSSSSREVDPNLISRPPPSLGSLKVLTFQFCPELEFSQEEQLPPNLKRLRILVCPKLKEWCIVHKDTKLAGVQLP